MIFVGICGGIVIPGSRKELVRIENPVTPVGDMFSVISVLFLLFIPKDGKGASSEGRDGCKGCLFPTRVGFFNFDATL